MSKIRLDKTIEQPNAGLQWIDIKKTPEPQKTYIIWFTDVPGGGCADIAYYEGKLSNGDHCWILSDITLDVRSISAYADVNEPIFEEIK